MSRTLQLRKRYWDDPSALNPNITQVMIYGVPAIEHTYQILEIDGFKPAHQSPSQIPDM
jgi:hypothetical protein